MNRDIVPQPESSIFFKMLLVKRPTVSFHLLLNTYRQSTNLPPLLKIVVMISTARILMESFRYLSKDPTTTTSKNLQTQKIITRRILLESFQSSMKSRLWIVHSSVYMNRFSIHFSSDIICCAALGSDLKAL
jgi:hypothetical protein